MHNIKLSSDFWNKKNRNRSFKLISFPYLFFHICPHCDITTGILGLLLGPVGTFSIFRITSNPSITRPNTTCFPSRKSHLAQVMKNWQPLVSFPLLAWKERKKKKNFNKFYTKMCMLLFNYGITFLPLRFFIICIQINLLYFFKREVDTPSSNQNW